MGEGPQKLLQGAGGYLEDCWVCSLTQTKTEHLGKTDYQGVEEGKANSFRPEDGRSLRLRVC